MQSIGKSITEALQFDGKACGLESGFVLAMLDHSKNVILW